MSNKSNGMAFEREFASLLSERGFWVHRLQDNRNGQPFDVIAVKNGEALAFDCKDCGYEGFPLRRIEENQITAMRLWQDCGNREGLFALNLPSGIRILAYTAAISLMENGVGQLRGDGLMEWTEEFEEWMRCELQ